MGARRRCCCGCEQLDEDFISSSWESKYDTTGTWTLTISGDYISTTSEGATLLSAIGYSGTAITFSVAASWADSSSATLDLVFLYADTDNYLFLRLSYVATVATMRLYSRLSGVDTAISNAITLEPDNLFGRTFQICWRETVDYYAGAQLEVSAMVVDGSGGVSLSLFLIIGTLDDSYIAQLGTKHGAIVADNTTNAEVDVYEVVVTRQTDDCIHCQCYACENFSAPATLNLTVSDVQTPESCCSGLNTNYTLTRGRNYLGSGDESSCVYTAAIDPPCQGIGEIRLTLVPYYGSAYTAIGLSFVTTEVGWFNVAIGGSTTLGAPPLDCSVALDGLVIEPNVYNQTDPLDSRCVFHVTQAITSTDIPNGSFTIAGDWSALTAGRIIAVALGLGSAYEYYTVVSVTGTGPTTIFVDETIPASRNGWIAIKGARAVISVP